ncbi:gas vesicle protein GvpL [Bacillus lacus]|uniref:Gas vesicle protein GvpL n=1 Tax=Metabacillus lacus TaxID=1983721 RepID=A0A7X2LYT0_9BACI|nr:GvpL/GvpF family gas vesicle protein [Metabacillus lacus]MRX71227.1 gas vesicle protein GvpL [Metabacillus lacus]
MNGLVYLYGLVPSKEAEEHALPQGLKGFDENSNILGHQIGELTAIVCELNPEEYSEDIIKDKTSNDMEWLQEKAFHHHETVLNLAKHYTVIPLKFCTIYKNVESLETTVAANQVKMIDTLDFITGNEEWNVKIYSDDKLLKEQVSLHNPTIEAKREEIGQLPKGKQFFEKKKLDKLVENELENEKNAVCEKVHDQLKEFTIKGNVKRTWSNDVTGKKEQMTWNGVYLISKPEVETFLKRVQQYEKDMKEAGWQFEVSGPWPAYHFSSFS